MDDEPDVLDLYCDLLRPHGYYIERTRTLQEAAALLRTQRFDLFICDIMMGDGRGTDLLREMLPHLRATGTHVVVVTGAGHYRTVEDEFGVDLFLTKPLEPDVFVRLVDRLLPAPHQSAS